MTARLLRLLCSAVVVLALSLMATRAWAQENDPDIFTRLDSVTISGNQITGSSGLGYQTLSLHRQAPAAVMTVYLLTPNGPQLVATAPMDAYFYSGVCETGPDGCTNT